MISRLCGRQSSGESSEKEQRQKILERQTFHDESVVFCDWKSDSLGPDLLERNMYCIAETIVYFGGNRIN